MRRLTVKELNAFQQEIKDIQDKYGVPLKELRLTLKKGTFGLSEPIILLKETTLIGGK